MMRFHAPQRMDGCFHRRASRETVVHDDHGAPGDEWMLAALAEQSIPSVELQLFADGNLLNERPGNAELFDKAIVQHLDATSSDGSHCEFGVAGDAELANQKDVQREPETPGDLGRNRNTAARQSQDDDVRSACILSQSGGQLFAGIRSILEPHHHHVRRPRSTAYGKRQVAIATPSCSCSNSALPDIRNSTAR
jgi:hypothetical protein